MKLVVITPVGPGHETFAAQAVASVTVANERGYVGFTSIKHNVVEDHGGQLGRSRARNLGMDKDADWYFFLDADDTMREDALSLNDFSSAATFGSVSLSGRVPWENIYPCRWRDIALYGASCTIAMGFFCRASVARRLRFNEAMNKGEDFDFYMRLPSFTKIDRPLVDIGYHLPSAGGARGYDQIDWVGICNDVIAEAVTREPSKYDLGGDAVLAAARSPRTKSGALP